VTAKFSLSAVVYFETIDLLQLNALAVGSLDWLQMIAYTNFSINTINARS